MRKGFVAVGLVLVILGAVLMFVPVFTSTLPGSASNPSLNNGAIGFNTYEASFSLFGGTTGKFSFSSPSPVDVAVISCSKLVTTAQLATVNSTAQFNSVCGTNTTYGTTSIAGIAYSNGTSGSFTVTIPSGGTLIWYALCGQNAPPTVTVTLNFTSPLFGLVLLALGVILLLVGVVLKPKKPKQPAAGPGAPQPWTPPGAPAPAPGPYAPGGPAQAPPPPNYR